MNLDGTLSEVQRAGDLLVGQPGYEQLQHVPLPRCKARPEVRANRGVRSGAPACSERIIAAAPRRPELLLGSRQLSQVRRNIDHAVADHLQARASSATPSPFGT
jgi:hypothetical protein